MRQDKNGRRESLEKAVWWGKVRVCGVVSVSTDAEVATSQQKQAQLGTAGRASRRAAAGRSSREGAASKNSPKKTARPESVCGYVVSPSVVVLSSSPRCLEVVVLGWAERDGASGLPQGVSNTQSRGTTRPRFCYYFCFSCYCLVSE